MITLSILNIFMILLKKWKSLIPGERFYLAETSRRTFSNHIGDRHAAAVTEVVRIWTITFARKIFFRTTSTSMGSGMRMMMLGSRHLSKQYSGLRRIRANIVRRTTGWRWCWRWCTSCLFQQIIDIFDRHFVCLQGVVLRYVLLGFRSR